MAQNILFSFFSGICLVLFGTDIMSAALQAGVIKFPTEKTREMKNMRDVVERMIEILKRAPADMRRRNFYSGNYRQRKKCG